MCDVLIPALIGVAALGLLGGGIGGHSECNTCGPGGSGQSIVIPQQAGEVTNGVPVSYGGGYYPAAPQPVYSGQSAYAPAAMPSYGEAAYGNGVNAGANIGGEAGVGAGGYINPGGVGLDANVVGVDASIGIGDRSY